MRTVFITTRTNLNEKLIKNNPEIELVNNPHEADFLISQSTCSFPEHMNKTIYIAVEPPLADHRVWCYRNFDKFHTVVCHWADIKKDNQIPFTPDDCPQYYPTRPDPFPFITRKDTTIMSRGVFYAGMIGFYDKIPDSCGGINITYLRRLIGEYLEKRFPESIMIGRGWHGQITKVPNWREDKQKKIIESKCDFVLALENTIYPNYLYEKIWDGFATDRVTLYLGDSRIEHHIPTNCFIDLRKWFNPKTKEFDLNGLGNYLKNITQEEYDEIIKNARKFRETSHGKYEYYRDLLTNKIIDIILK